MKIMTGVVKFLKNCSGSIMMESVVLLPVVLLVLMAAVQFAHIFFARQITRYAAYSAARSGRVALTPAAARENALKAARQACSMLALSAPAGNNGSPYALPWLGEVAGSQNLDEKISVNCSPEGSPDGAFATEVVMNFPLVVPVVNSFLSGLLKFRDEVNPEPVGGVTPDIIQDGTLRSFARVSEGDIFPHITIKSRALLPANPQLAD